MKVWLCVSDGILMLMFIKLLLHAKSRIITVHTVCQAKVPVTRFTFF